MFGKLVAIENMTNQLISNVLNTRDDNENEIKCHYRDQIKYFKVCLNSF